MTDSEDLCAHLTALCLELLVFAQKSPHIGLYQRKAILESYADEYLAVKEQVARVLGQQKAPDSL